MSIRIVALLGFSLLTFDSLLGMGTSDTATETTKTRIRYGRDFLLFLRPIPKTPRNEDLAAIFKKLNGMLGAATVSNDESLVAIIQELKKKQK